MPGVLPWLSLVFLGLLSFANAVPHPFVHDDIVFIAQNPQIAHLDHLSSVFLPLHQQGPQGINAYYRPVLEIIYRLEYRAFGFNAHGFHLVNVLLHIANGLLVFGLLRRLRFTPAIAWVVSALFLVHPLQSEAVACIAGISNLAMALMVLLTLHAYLSRWYVLTFLLFIAALLTKEQALMLPLLMVGLDIDQGRARRSYGMWAVWVMTGILFLWFRHVVSGSSVLADVMQSPGELLLRLKAIGPVLLTDLRLIVAPYDLHYYRNYDILKPALESWLILSILVIAIARLAVKHPLWRRPFAVGGCWFFAALLPVLNIVPLINEYSLILTADHFLYLPIVGILLMIVVYCRTRLREGAGKVLAALVIAVCMGLTIYQNTFWRNEAVLFERTMQFEPRFARGHMLLAKAYYFQKDYLKAIPYFQQAHDIMAGYEAKAGNATAKHFYQGFRKGILFDWAQTHVALGQWDEAIHRYEQAIAIDPNDAVLYNNLAIVFLYKGDKPKAIDALHQALHANPDFAPAKANLSQWTVP